MATNPNSPTFARDLWREVLAGEKTPDGAFYRICFGARDLTELIDSMPDDMLLMFRDFLTPVPNDKGGLKWPDPAMRMTSLDLDAFDSWEAAFERRDLRLRELLSAIQKRDGNTV